MPNGGSDCCGTCWFNKKNKGEASYDYVNDPEPDYCIIRNLDIQIPFYTYCANHPRHSPEKEETPVGPAFVANSVGHREIWIDSPDTEKIREKLLTLLNEVEEVPEEEYPAGLYRDDIIIWQLGEFREKGALSALKRISQFDPNAEAKGKFPRNRAKTVALAKQAIEKIEKQSTS